MKFVQPYYGGKRTKCGFLWLPLKIGRETRWLEFARWEEQYSGWSKRWRVWGWIG